MTRLRRVAAVMTAAFIVGVLAASGALAAAPPARAAEPESFSRSVSSEYRVTLAARVCDNYSDIMANRARNDIQESLQDLGPDTVYRAGQALDPAIEDATSPDCRPLTGVGFTFGANYQKLGQYSTVTANRPGVDGPSGITQNGVPLLDRLGNPTGGTIDGATTYLLNTAQVTQASRNNQFWVQGGTRAAPLPPRPGGGSYGFGALRCAIDNLNGDNVEWIGYPGGTPSSRHVFCFAYYIDTPPPQGTIVIRKELTPGATVSQEFRFASNATYNPNGIFGLKVNNGVPAETTFIRAVSSEFGGPYTFAELDDGLVAAGWSLDSVTCTGPGASVDPVTQVASVDLQANTTVRCTWVDDPPRDPGLTVRKVTTGAVGTFAMTAQRVADAAGSPVTDPVIPLTATTTAEDEPVTAVGLPATVAPGTWVISETLPTAQGGTWSAVQAYCNGITRTVDAAATPNPSVTVDLPVNGGADCTFVNQFTPLGVLEFQLVTLGGTGTGAFNVTTAASPRFFLRAGTGGLNQSATTTAPDAPALASGDPTDALALERYAAISTPPATTPEGSWDFVSFDCGLAVVDAGGEGGSLEVTLTAASPSALCTAVYRLVPATTLDLVKDVQAQPGARPGFAVLTANCDDGSAGQVAVPPGPNGATGLPEPLSFSEPTTCVIDEPENGGAPDATVGTIVSVEVDGVATVGELPLSLDVDRTVQTIVVTVLNDYSLADTPILPPTGVDARGGVGVGIAGLLLGAAVLLVGRRRSGAGRARPRA